jgi:hypothetical protein
MSMRMFGASLGITVLVEATVAWLWCRRNRKPVAGILLTGLAGNNLTQAALWTLLFFLSRPYWPVLLSAELVIWLVEAAILAAVPSNRLTPAEAAWLSLWMNLSSFGVGLLLPV